MDISTLRNVIEPLIVGLKDACTHDTLPELCATLGIPLTGCTGSKRERMQAAFDDVPDSLLPDVTQSFITTQRCEASDRITLQDLLWADYPHTIPRKYRRELASALEAIELFGDARHFDMLLDSLWNLDDDPLGIWGDPSRSLRGQIERHVHRNPGDWGVVELFDRLGAFDASDCRFALFVEGLVSSKVRPDEVAQRQFSETVNRVLRACSLELVEVDNEDGYPVFQLVCTARTVAGRPKNLIFASQVKPDLRFRDSVNNDIEIVTNEDKVLIYDRPITVDGLRWSDLQLWWAETNCIADDEAAKAELYRRLRDSLPGDSPPQRQLFEGFYRGFGAAVPKLPALLPEVWLHWDPKTVRERGTLALVRFRMDFLLLLPGGVRVVIEVDGKHHYADDNGRASPPKYASMMAADRELRLSGYEVYRFGATELSGDGASSSVTDFFVGLFKRHGVAVN